MSFTGDWRVGPLRTRQSWFQMTVRDQGGGWDRGREPCRRGRRADPTAGEGAECCGFRLSWLTIERLRSGLVCNGTKCHWPPVGLRQHFTLPVVMAQGLGRIWVCTRGLAWCAKVDNSRPAVVAWNLTIYLPEASLYYWETDGEKHFAR